MMRFDVSTEMVPSRCALARRDDERETTAFSPALRRALESETRLRASRGFDERFFAALEEKRVREGTLRGQIERLLESEIAGMAVWRLLGSSLAGGFLPALVLACCLIAPPEQRATPPLPPQLRALTPFQQRKFWEEAAWKTPFQSQFWALLDPHFRLGGESCASPLVA